MKQMKRIVLLLLVTMLTTVKTFASEADIAIPDLHKGSFHLFGQVVLAWDFLFYGALVICITLSISLFSFHKSRNSKRIVPC